MRVNVYAEELPLNTDRDILFITKEVEGRTFYGVRLFLESSPELHHTETDDDRSAITFWVPWRAGENHHGILLEVLRALVGRAEDAQMHERRFGG